MVLENGGERNQGSPSPYPCTSIPPPISSSAPYPVNPTAALQLIPAPVSHSPP